MDKRLKVRKAKLKDLDRIAKMQLAMQEHHEKSNPSVWRYSEEKEEVMRRELEQQLKDTDHLILISEIENEIVGFAHGAIQHSTVHVPSIAGRIMSVYVLENYRRRGIGSKLIKETCRFFKSNNAKGVTLRYVLGNTEGEKFWRHCGFEPILVTAGAYINTIEKKIS